MVRCGCHCPLFSFQAGGTLQGAFRSNVSWGLPWPGYPPGYPPGCLGCFFGVPWKVPLWDPGVAWRVPWGQATPAAWLSLRRLKPKCCSIKPLNNQNKKGQLPCVLHCGYLYAPFSFSRPFLVLFKSFLDSPLEIVFLRFKFKKDVSDSVKSFALI